MMWRIRWHRGRYEFDENEDDRSEMNSHEDENLECAGCEHPIVDGQPFVVFVPTAETGQGHEQQRKSRWASFTGSWAALLAGVAAFGNGVENVSGVIPPFARDFLREHGDLIKGKGKDVAIGAATGARGAAVYLKGIPHIGAIATAAMLVVIVSAAAYPAISKARHGRASTKNSENELLYFHVSCPQCGGQSCLRPIDGEEE